MKLQPKKSSSSTETIRSRSGTLRQNRKSMARISVTKPQATFGRPSIEVGRMPSAVLPRMCRKPRSGTRRVFMPCLNSPRRKRTIASWKPAQPVVTVRSAS